MILVLFIFGYADEVPVLSAWTGRGLFSGFSIGKAIRSFEGKLPEGLSLRKGYLSPGAGEPHGGEDIDKDDPGDQDQKEV